MIINPLHPAASFLGFFILRGKDLLVTWDRSSRPWLGKAEPEAPKKGKSKGAKEGKGGNWTEGFSAS